MPVDSHSHLYLVPSLFPLKGRTPGRRWHCPRPCPRQPRPPTPPHPAAPRAPAVEGEWTPSGAGACVVRYLCLCSQNRQHASSLAQQRRPRSWRQPGLVTRTLPHAPAFPAGLVAEARSPRRAAPPRHQTCAMRSPAQQRDTWQRRAVGDSSGLPLRLDGMHRRQCASAVEPPFRQVSKTQANLLCSRTNAPSDIVPVCCSACLLVPIPWEDPFTCAQGGCLCSEAHRGRLGSGAAILPRCRTSPSTATVRPTRQRVSCACTCAAVTCGRTTSVVADQRR